MAFRMSLDDPTSLLVRRDQGEAGGAGPTARQSGPFV